MLSWPLVCFLLFGICYSTSSAGRLNGRHIMRALNKVLHFSVFIVISLKCSYLLAVHNCISLSKVGITPLTVYLIYSHCFHWILATHSPTIRFKLSSSQHSQYPPISWLQTWVTALECLVLSQSDRPLLYHNYSVH